MGDNFLLISSSLDFLGSLMVAYTALRVHYRFWQEHKITASVFTEMKRERTVGLIGILFLASGFFLEFFVRFYA